jgi:hypothetical protein
MRACCDDIAYQSAPHKYWAPIDTLIVHRPPTRAASFQIALMAITAKMTAARQTTTQIVTVVVITAPCRNLSEAAGASH